MENTLKQNLDQAFSEWAKTGFMDEEKEKVYEKYALEYEKQVRDALALTDDEQACSLDDDECLSCGS